METESEIGQFLPNLARQSMRQRSKTRHFVCLSTVHMRHERTSRFWEGFTCLTLECTLLALAMGLSPFYPLTVSPAMSKLWTCEEKEQDWWPLIREEWFDCYYFFSTTPGYLFSTRGAFRLTESHFIMAAHLAMMARALAPIFRAFQQSGMSLVIPAGTQ